MAFQAVLLADFAVCIVLFNRICPHCATKAQPLRKTMSAQIAMTDRKMAFLDDLFFKKKLFLRRRQNWPILATFYPTVHMVLST